MVDYNTEFNTSGKFPTMEDFWAQTATEWTTGDGITPEFSRVLGEQVFRPVYGPITPFYDAFVGRPLASGAGWMERIIGKSPTKRFNPKATAQDDLGFYDSQGLEFSFKVDLEGRKSVSLPSSLVSVEMFIRENGVGQLNSLLVDNVLQGYQRDMESEIGMKAISTTKNEATLDAATSEDPQAILKSIQRYATAFRGDATHYNDLEENQNGMIYTNSEDVLVFMPQTLLDDILDSFATLPSPDRIVRNARIIPVPDELPTPITTTEFTAGVVEGDSPGTVITKWTEGTKPAAIDKAKPDIWMCAANRVEYRPLIGSYRVNLSRNGAGDFANEHLLWRGAIAIKPWENALRINLTEA